MADKTIGVPATSGFVNDVEAYRHSHKLGSTAEAMRDLANKALEREKRLVGKVETEDNSAMAPIAENTKGIFMQMWTENPFENYELVRGDMQKDAPLGGALVDLKDLHKGEPAIIMGSGPSADGVTPLLKDWKGLIFSGPTQVQTLFQHNLRPQYLVAYDPNPDFHTYMQIEKAPKDYYDGIQLITVPNIDPGFTHRWAERGWPRKWFMTFTSHKKDPLQQEPPRTVEQWIDHYKPKSEHPMSFYVDDEFSIFFLRTMIRAFQLNPRMCQRGIKHEGVQPMFWNTGSTPNQSVLVADFMGCYPIFMMGNDLCYAKDGRERAETWHLNDKGVREPMEFGHSDSAVVMTDSGRPTRMEFVVYKNAFLRVLTQPELRYQQVWECAQEGEWGMMDILPRITGERLIETQGLGLERWDPDERTAKINEYMKAHLQFGDPDAQVVLRSSLPSA